MNILRNVVALAIFAAGIVWPQTNQIASIRIATNVNGPRFYVDGVQYTTPQVFLWPAGSKHTLEFPLFQQPDGTTQPYQLSLDGAIRWQFGGWQDGNGLLAVTNAPQQTITADPRITAITGTVTPNYKISLRFSTSPTASPTCGGAPGQPPQDSPRAGLIYLGSQCVGSNTDVFLGQGAINLNAFPYPGWVFAGWSLNGAMPTPYLLQYTVTGPATLYAIFVEGKRVKFITDPVSGFQVLIDRTPMPTSSANPTDLRNGITPQAVAYCQPDFLRFPPDAPVGLAPLCFGEFDFAPGSKHTVGAPSPQYDSSGNPWVFDSFSNGLKAGDTYTADNNIAAKDVVTARFVPGVKTSIITVPNGMKISVDGRDNWGSYNFIWGAGTKHTVSAPALQTLNGRKYAFKGWSNGGPATQDITLASDAQNVSITATYEILPQVTIRSTPSGVNLDVDGQMCKTPCVLDRAKGSMAVVTAATQIPLTDVQRWDFLGWSDGGPAARNVAFNADTQALSVSYTASYKLNIIADPAGSADFQLTPSSPDGFFADGTAVTVAAKPKGGFRFRRYDGDIQGTSATGSLILKTVGVVYAFFDKVPFIPSAGIKSAVGDIPVDGLAANSVISIYGDNLAREFEVGRDNPLSQAIGGVTVTMTPGDRLLSLLFVAPSQINAVLPSDLPDGSYKLTVRWDNQTVQGDISVVRNAPGLFPQTIGTTVYALATHLDGSLITPDSPAAKGEEINVYGTGFGPYDKPIIDGFTIPPGSVYKVVDPVTVTLGSANIAVGSSQAAAAMAGTIVTRVTVPVNAASGSQNLTFTVNGKKSNTVLLPVQ